MDKLTTFQFNNSRKLFELAKKLNSKKFFDVFLNEAQYKILNYILLLDNFEIWYNFLEGNCLIKFKKVESEEVEEGEEQKKEKDEEKDAVGDDEKEEDEEKYQDQDMEDADEGEEKIEEKIEDEVPDSEKIEDKNGETENVETNDDEQKDQELQKVPLENEILFEDGVKMIKMLALHIRYLLWEKAIDFYYNSKTLDSKVGEISDDFELMETLDEENEKEEVVEPVKEVKVRDEEDDYDMDEDDEEEEKEKEKEKEEPKDEATDTSNSPVFDPETALLLLEIPSTIFTTTTKPQEIQRSESKDDSIIPEPINEDQENLIKEFNKVYHNFEYDRETLLKRRKLEQSDLQLEDSKEPQTDDGDEGDDKFDDDIDKNMTITLGAASTSLQHLLTTIQQKREEVPLNDFELRTLFMDVRKNRGKWANDDRVGQEELYEACEKVVMELRGYTEHSTPFLNKVSKREAPNYGLIIKKPMDLNTVMKKLKVLSYNSKQEFVDDIMLIWSNCLTYNADPKHFLRAHALAMQKKALKLVPLIPDIVIRSRTELEKEEDDDKGTPIGGGKSMKKGRKRTRQDQVKVEDTPGTPGLDSEVEEIEEEQPEVEIKVEANEEEEEPVEEKTEKQEKPEKPEEPENEDEINQTQLLNELDEEFDPELQAWRSLTAKSRANYCAHRSQLFDSHNHLRPDAKAILRQSGGMENFNHYLNNTEVISKNSNLLENDELYLLEYDVTGGLPGIAYKGIDKEEEDRRENELVDRFLQEANGDASKISSQFVLPVDTGLNKIYTENITQIQEIRKICFKISLIRQMQTQQFVHHTQMKQPVIEAVKEVDVDDVSKLSNHDSFDKDVQFAVLRRNMCKVAMQTGFESTEPTAINTLTQLAERYLGNLIKSMKLHTESTSSNELTAREILLVSLLENGVDKPDDLYTYVQEKVLKQHQKLKDLRSNLSNFLKELLRPGLKNFNERSFEDNSEQFMTGDFSNDLGDDFFGFKELGLDKEFKMLTSSIPIYLLHSKLHKSYSSTGNESKANKYEDLKDFEPKHLIASSIDSQIGILKHFYAKLYDKSKVHYIKMQKKKGESTELPENNSLVLIEDEELPQKQRNIRPRLPPTGKIGGVKKKIIANGFFLDDEEVI